MPTPITTKPSSIASRLKSFGVVHAALTIQSEEAVKVLVGRKIAAPGTDPEMAAEATFEAGNDNGYHQIFSQLASELEMAKTEMISTNSTHLGQLALIVDLKARRGRLNDTLAGRFVKARQTFETFYGADQRFPMLAIVGDTPNDPTGLVAQIRDTVSFLQDPQVTLPALDLQGVELDPTAIAAQLAEGADELAGVLVDVNQAEKQADITRQAKNGALSAYDRKFLRVAHLAEGIFHFAGMHELATRVRPSARRPGRRLAEGKEVADTSRSASEATESQQTESQQTETQQASSAPIDSQPAEAQVEADGTPDALPVDS